MTKFHPLSRWDRFAGIDRFAHRNFYACCGQHPTPNLSTAPEAISSVRECFSGQRVGAGQDARTQPLKLVDCRDGHRERNIPNRSSHFQAASLASARLWSLRLIQPTAQRVRAPTNSKDAIPSAICALIACVDLHVEVQVPCPPNQAYSIDIVVTSVADTKQIIEPTNHQPLSTRLMA